MPATRLLWHEDHAASRVPVSHADAVPAAAASIAPDHELLQRLARGEREALAPLAARHYTRLYRIALSYLRNPDDALEVVQETFVKAVHGAARWQEGAEAGAWLTRIAINHAIDRYRRGRRRGVAERSLDDGERAFELPAEGPSPERHALGRELGERIERALRTLPERQRAVFVLRHHHDLSLEEIGRYLDMNIGTVKSNLHRALQHLRRRLSGVRQ